MLAKGDKAKVQGLGKAMIGGVTEFSPGDEVEAELVKPAGLTGQRLGIWFVKFPNDLDPAGNQILRVRQLV